MHICAASFTHATDQDLCAPCWARSRSQFSAQSDRTACVRQAAQLWRVGASSSQWPTAVSCRAADPVYVLAPQPLLVCISACARRDDGFTHRLAMAFVPQAKEENMPRKELTRRAFLSMSTKAGAGTVLAMYGGTALTAASAAAPNAPATAADLRFVWWGGQLRPDVTTRVINTVAAQHPDIKSSFGPLGFDTYRTTMTIQTPRGGLLDISQYGASTAHPAVLQTLGMLGGTIYGVSTGPRSFAIDSDAFAQAGITLPARTWTSAHFEAVVGELHTKLGLWGLAVFQNHGDASTALCVISLGNCPCASCRAQRKQLAAQRGPTPLMRISQVYA